MILTSVMPYNLAMSTYIQHYINLHTVIAEKDELLTSFLNLISDEQRRKQRKLSTKGMEKG